MTVKAGPNIVTDGLVFNLDPANVKSYPYRSEASLILDGTTIADKSRNAYSITANGNAAVSSEVKLFDKSTYYFDGNGDYLTLNSSSFSFGTGDFTIEFWAYPTQSTIGSGFLSEVFTGSGRVELSIFTGVTGGVGTNYYLTVGHYNGSSWQYVISAGEALVNNQWSHVRVVRSSGVLYLFINGILKGSGSFPVDVGVGNGWLLARRWDTYSSGGQWPYYYGYITNILVLKGISLGTSNFTPPQNLVFPNNIYDLRNDIVGTLTNGPVFSNVQNGVMSFDGNNDYIAFSSNSNFEVGTGDFSIEAWVKFNELETTSPIFTPDTNLSTSYNNYWYFAIDQTSLLILGRHFTSQSSVPRCTFSRELNRWYHLVGTRMAGVSYIYIDGVSQSISSNTGLSGVNFNQNGAIIGRINGTPSYGNISIGNLRLYKNRGLTASEVQKNYLATRKRFEETPKTVSGLQLWLDAADLSTLRQNSNGTTSVALASDPVGYWGDKSGNGRHATQATAGNRPTLIINGQNNIPGIVTNGSTQWMDGSWSTFDPLTLFVVFKHISGTSGSRIFTQSDSSTGDSIIVSGSTYWLPLAMNAGPLVVTYNTVDSAIATISITTGTTCILQHTRDNLNITNQKDKGAISTATLSEAITRVMTKYTLGRTTNASAGYVAGQYFEVVAYNKILSDYEYKSIINYLNKKWGVF